MWNRILSLTIEILSSKVTRDQQPKGAVPLARIAEESAQKTQQFLRLIARGTAPFGC